MLINFRQGVIAPTTNFLTLLGGNVTINVAANSPVQVAVAQLDTNYLFQESATVNNAWVISPFSGTGRYWLYWDFNVQTFARTFGYTTLAPVVGATPPANPLTGQMWFNTATVENFFWNGAQWVQCLRVFAAFLNAGVFQSMGTGPGFTGTQVGLTTPNSSTGSVLFDQTSLAFHHSNGTFLTTEDLFFTNATIVNGIRLESNVLSAVSDSSSIAAFSPVAWQTNGNVANANYDDIGVTIIGMATQSMLLGQNGAIITQGTVTNPNWTWLSQVHFDGSPVQVGDELWCNFGQLVVDDPHVLDPITYPVGQVPVARVLTTTSVIFEQGLGGIGPQGPPGSVAGVHITVNSLSSGLQVSGSPLNANGTLTLSLNAELQALSLLATLGLVARTGVSTYTPRSITAASSRISVTNANGAAGNPTLDVVEANLNIGNMGGTLLIAHGGTSATTAQAALNNLLPTQTGNAGLYLQTNGTNPSWQGINLSTNVTGVLPIGNGGTGQTTQQAAFDALSPLTTPGDLLTFSGGHNVRFGIGSNTQVLTVVGGALSWQTPSSGSVSSVDVQPTGGTFGLTSSGGPITSSGVIHLTLGTELQGLSQLSTNGIVVRTSPGVYTTDSIVGTTNQITVVNGSGVAGNPTLSISTTYPGQTSINILGTVTTGIWQSTAITAGFGGTGQVTYAKGDLLVGNASTTLDKLPVGTDGQLLVANSAATDGVNWSSSGIASLFMAPGANITLSSGIVTGLLPPVNPSDATNKTYVDMISAGLTVKFPVFVATTANLTATASGSGVGKTLTNSGTQVQLIIDGEIVSAGNRVLVKNQTNHPDNGVYTVTNIGSGSTNWVLTRATDFDGHSPTGLVNGGDFVFVEEGTVNSQTGWVVAAIPTSPFTDVIVVDTDPMVWNQFSGAGAVTMNFAADTGGFATLTSGQTLTLHGGVGITTSRVGNTITFTASSATLEYIQDTSLHGGPKTSYLINHALNQQYVEVQCYDQSTVGNFAVTAVSPGAGGTFTIAGNHTAIFTPNFQFMIIGSTNNNGSWIVSSSAFGGVNTVITVTGTVNAVADGTIYTGPKQVIPDQVVLIDANNCGVSFGIAVNVFVVVTGISGIFPV